MSETNVKVIDAIRRFRTAINTATPDDRYGDARPREYTVFMSSETFLLLAGKNGGRQLERDGTILKEGQRDEAVIYHHFRVAQGVVIVCINDDMGELIEVI